jgi:hypothetical protein
MSRFCTARKASYFRGQQAALRSTWLVVAVDSFRNGTAFTQAIDHQFG